MRYVLAVLIFLIPSFASAETVYFEGTVDSKIVDHTIRKLSPGDTLVLNSQGGNGWEAYRLSEFVRSNKIKTRVNSTGWCLSACVMIFASGVERSAGKNALFMLHSGKLPSGEVAQQATVWYLEKLIHYGVSIDIAKLPIINDEMVLNYALAKYVGLVTD